ncbi:uncharacterized protein LOC124142137 [Haliotis rufescens]|uniref:uncharacterized protein LOC124142137 n=1 Tax=Haliotis rufescens TaxID=6454 RepID=UPI00201EDF6C|nr:uncharacterized protein LOC124142137 [Haliotis rufescens]
MMSSSYVQDRMFHQDFTPAATPVPHRRPCVYRPEPLSALPTSYTSVPVPAPVSVSVNITGHVIMVDTDFVEIDLGREEDTQPLPPQSFLRALLSRFIRLVKRVFTSNKDNV